jgi:HAE1 family hydrophobic/amphiphilic exporter-1
LVLDQYALFAMILAIGIVDDAIVVVEAVHAKLDEGAKSAKDTLSAMSETRRIISITLVMSAVFILFLSGPAGVFYNSLQ